MTRRSRSGRASGCRSTTLVLLPAGTEAAGAGLAFERDLANGRLFRAVSPGIIQACADSWAAFVRIAPEAYMGLAQYRHLGRGNASSCP